MTEITKIEAAVQPLLDQEAVDLVDVECVHEGGRRVLRFFLDKPGGFKLDDCAYFSDRIGALLDTVDLVNEHYVLEVSSPGVNRILKKERDFLRFAGHRAKVRLKTPENGQRNFRGCLKPMEAGLVVLDSDGSLVRFPLDRIDEARLDPEIDI